MKHAELCLAAVLAMMLPGTVTYAQSAAAILGPPGVVPPSAPQPLARLIVDPPLPGPLDRKTLYFTVPETAPHPHTDM